MTQKRHRDPTARAREHILRKFNSSRRFARARRAERRRHDPSLDARASHWMRRPIHHCVAKRLRQALRLGENHRRARTHAYRRARAGVAAFTRLARAAWTCDALSATREAPWGRVTYTRVDTSVYVRERGMTRTVGERCPCDAIKEGGVGNTKRRARTHARDASTRARARDVVDARRRRCGDARARSDVVGAGARARERNGCVDGTRGNDARVRRRATSRRARG